jgi:transcriptional regulator with XRE-family HTH domain
MLERATMAPSTGYHIVMPAKSPGLLAERLLLERRALSLTQDELATRSGVSRPHIANIERGRSLNLSTDVVFALAKALGVTVPYLLGLSDNPLATEQNDELANAESQVVYEVKQPRVRNLAQRLIDTFIELSPGDQDTIIRIAETLRQSQTPRIIGDENPPSNR